MTIVIAVVKAARPNLIKNMAVCHQSAGCSTALVCAVVTALLVLVFVDGAGAGLQPVNVSASANALKVKVFILSPLFLLFMLIAVSHSIKVQL